MKNSYVTINGTDVYPCLIAEGNWNGWAIPYMEYGTVAKYVRDVADDGRYNVQLGMLGQGRMLYVDYEEGFYLELNPTEIDGKDYYDFGACSFTWSECDKDGGEA